MLTLHHIGGGGHRGLYMHFLGEFSVGAQLMPNIIDHWRSLGRFYKRMDIPEHVNFKGRQALSAVSS